MPDGYRAAVIDERARPDGLSLPPSAESAGLARRHVRERLARAGRSHWSDAAELAVSEVVTNGLLHAHTGLQLRVLVEPAHVLVEVADGSPVLPAQRLAHDVDEGTTGRGLALLAAITLARGVRATSSGKVVWFTVGDDAATDEDALLAAFDGDAEWDLDPPVAPGAGRSVVLLGMPITLWIAVREHQQTLLRELVLYLAEHGDALPEPPDLVLADAARTLIWTAFVAALSGRDDGTDNGALPPPPTPSADAAARSMDLEIVVPPELEASFGALQDALDVAEELARQDLLLVRPGLPEIVAVRDWACEQVVAQLAGVPASPWPGTDHERFTGRVTGPGHDDWDASVVTSSPRSVVAADEANRIVAVSPALAALTGWDADDLVGRRVVALIPPALREAHVAGFSRHLTTGRANVLGVPLVLPVLRRDGSELTCRFLVERAEGTDRLVYLAWIEPVTA